MQVRWPFLPPGMLRRKCKDSWFRMTGRAVRKEKKILSPKRKKQRVSFNESAEVRRIGSSPSSQAKRSGRLSHFSPLKSDPIVHSANRCRKTSIEVIIDPVDEWSAAGSESPISRRMQQLEIGRRGSDAAGGDRPYSSITDHTIQFPDSPTPVFQDMSPPSSPQSSSPVLSFTRRSSSGLFSNRQRTYTGFSSRHDDQPSVAPQNKRSVDPPVTGKKKRKLAESELVRLSGRCAQRSLATTSEVVRLVRRRPSMRTLASDLIKLVKRVLPLKETPKTGHAQTPHLVPGKPKEQKALKKK